MFSTFMLLSSVEVRGPLIIHIDVGVQEKAAVLELGVNMSSLFPA